VHTMQLERVHLTPKIVKGIRKRLRGAYPYISFRINCYDHEISIWRFLRKYADQPSSLDLEELIFNLNDEYKTAFIYKGG